MDRLNQLEAYYKEDPDDPLNMYMLALEYKKIDTDRSIKLFMELIEKHPAYMPAYFITAELLSSMNQHESAIKILQDGLKLAQNIGDIKTESELNNLQSELLFE